MSGTCSTPLLTGSVVPKPQTGSALCTACQMQWAVHGAATSVCGEFASVWLSPKSKVCVCVPGTLESNGASVLVTGGGSTIGANLVSPFGALPDRGKSYPPVWFHMRRRQAG